MADDTSQQRPLNSTAASLLGFLHEGPMSGWDLITTAQDRIGDFWTITQSQVYRELATMDKNGLVSKGEAGARDRTPYHITDSGRSTFAEWIARHPGAETIRFPLLLTLNFGDHLAPEHLEQFVGDGREVHQRRLGRYLAEDMSTLPAHRRATLEFGITYERAVLSWFDRLPELLQQAPASNDRPH